MTAAPVVRPLRFTLNLSEREFDMLSELASEGGVNRADVVRLAIRAKHEARFGVLVAGVTVAGVLGGRSKKPIRASTRAR